jgi:hypothetical protein
MGRWRVDEKIETEVDADKADAAGTTYHITFFRDEFATSLSTAELTLEKLAARIRKQTATTKAKLPWLKMARFGRKAAKGSKCLRHDANVLEVTGIELDYDEMRVTFKEALDCIRDMKIRAIVYTSPSHQDNKPKWRVLCPTSKPIKPEMRARLVARLNGAMAKPVTKRESFTLSQSYYFGQAADNPNPNHQVVVLDGAYIDERDDLGKFEKLGMVGDKESSTGSRRTARRSKVTRIISLRLVVTHLTRTPRNTASKPSLPRSATVPASSASIMPCTQRPHPTSPGTTATSSAPISSRSCCARRFGRLPRTPTAILLR